MNFIFTVTVTVEREEGKFASREELEAALVEALDDADPSSIETNNDATYNTTEWTVEAAERPTRRAIR